MNNVRDALKVIGVVILALVVLLGITWLAQGNDWFLYKVFAPKYEQTRRDVFETSRAFNQGLNQEIANMRFQYEQAEPEHKDALRSIILHRVAGDEDHLSPDLQAWVTNLKGETLDVEAR